MSAREAGRHKRCSAPLNLVLSGHRTCCQRLAPLKSCFAWSHAIRSKMPARRADTKGVSHLLNPFVHFFCCAQKKWTKEKGTAARGLSGEFLAPALPDAAVARVESRFARRLGVVAFICFILMNCELIDRKPSPCRRGR